MSTRRRYVRLTTRAALHEALKPVGDNKIIAEWYLRLGHDDIEMIYDTDI
jgi:hypothetical protein